MNHILINLLQSKISSEIYKLEDEMKKLHGKGVKGTDEEFMLHSIEWMVYKRIFEDIEKIKEEYHE